MASTFFLSLKPVSSPTLSFPSTLTHYQPILTTPLTNSKSKTHNSFPKIPLSSSFNNYSNTPREKDCPVPFDQQPINEYQSLSNSFPFSWAVGDIIQYCSRLCFTGFCFALFLGLPVSWAGSIGFKPEPIKLLLGSASTGLFVVILAVVRMYLGWAYVGNRLLSATVEYEETGWYDGQIWVKTAEVLARDRLLGSFSVKPVLGRLKNTLVVVGISLLMFIDLFINSGGNPNAYIAAPQEPGGRSVPGVYNDASARSFEPDAFCGQGEPQPESELEPIHP